MRYRFAQIVIGLCLCGGLASASANAEQLVSTGLRRISAPENAKLAINGVDDRRVDAGVAVLDSGINFDNPDLNVVKGVDCFAAEAPTYKCDTESPDAGHNSVGHGHGSATAKRVAAIDNGSGLVGVAPGARLYAIHDLPDGYWSLTGAGKEPFEVHLAPAIAALRWVTAHADEIDVAVGGPASLCSFEPLSTGYPWCGATEEREEFEVAAQEMVDAGVVWVIQASNLHEDVAGLVGASNPNAITVSAMEDTDGLPGGEGEAVLCKSPWDTEPTELDKDDTLSYISDWGTSVDIAAPGCATSDATPLVAGAAAVLASVHHPESREDVEAIRETLIEAGRAREEEYSEEHSNEYLEEHPYWTDDSGDGVQEPLLYVGDEEIFDPITVPGDEYHTPRVEAESYPLTFAGKGPTTLSSTSASIECKDSGLQTQALEAANEFALSPEYDECITNGHFPTTVSTNGCHYELHVQNAGPPYTATLGVACEEEGAGIEYRTFLKSGSLLCTTKVVLQPGLGDVSLANLGEGAERGVEFDAQAEGVQYERSGPCEPEPEGVHIDGVLAAKMVLMGENKAEESVGVYLAGEELPLGVYLTGEESEVEGVQPRLEAESYPLSLTGEGFPSFTAAGGTVECGESGLRGELTGTSDTLSLSAEYGGCLEGSEHLTTVSTNGCHYELHVQNAGPPYTATLGVACEEEGAGIEYRVYFAEDNENLLICTVKVGAQLGLGGVGLSNFGAGTERGVALDAEIEGIEYKQSGIGCGAGTHTDGAISGETTLNGIGS